MDGGQVFENQFWIGRADLIARDPCCSSECSLNNENVWKPVFNTTGVKFISLQYGDTKAEIEEIRRIYGVDVYQDSKVDIFEDVAVDARQHVE